MTDPGKSPESAFPLRVLSQKVEGWIARLGEVWVQGQLTEISLKRGWAWITLRDTTADVSMSVSCRAAVFESSGPLAEGAEVVVHGKISWWTKSGRITLQADEFRPVGQGQLLAQLEKRKQLLRAEGLFDPQLKKRLPLVPRSIGLITGKGSAAEQDVVENATRRWPSAHFVTAYAAMQGPKCVPEVIDALRRLDELPEVDVIVIARGGGSLDDLLPFSDESLVRGVFAARTPVVSAIGHDVDSPILDLVADVRVSTPTDAGKTIVPDAVIEQQRISSDIDRLRLSIITYVSREQQRISGLTSRPVLVNPAASVDVHVDRLHQHLERLQRAALLRIREEQLGIESALARLRTLSPKATLERGYAILVEGGASVTSTRDVTPGTQISALVLDGEIHLTVDDVEPHERKEHHG